MVEILVEVKIENKPLKRKEFILNGSNYPYTYPTLEFLDFANQFPYARRDRGSELIS